MDLLEKAFAFLRDEVAPYAQAIDQDPEALRTALRGLCARDLMALKRPVDFGGPGLDEPSFRKFQEECARASGALAFLQTQHQSAVGMIASSDNPSLKREYLPKMANGERLVGIGFSQLRRSGPPIMRARVIDGGYVLDGSVPWVTGWSFFHEFLVGAALEDGRSVFAAVPLPTERIPGIEVSAPMRLAAMDTAQTVSVDFSSFFVPDAQVAFVREAGWIKNSDMINIALQGHFAMGCTEAALDVLRANATKKPFPFLQGALEVFERELASLRTATDLAQLDVSEETTDERLLIRAWAIDLAARCAHAAIAASSGAANSLSHPAQRIYREAIVYTVSAQTPAIMEATLARLARPQPSNP